MNDFRELILSKFPFNSTVLEIFHQSELHLDESDLLIGQFREIFNRTDLPTSFLKSFFLTLFHRLFHFAKGSESFLAYSYYAFRRFLRFLDEYLHNYDYIQVDPIYDSPGGIGIDYSQFMTPSTDRGIGREWGRPRFSPSCS